MKKTINNGGNGSTTIYSTKELTEVLGVKESFVNSLLRDGILKGFKMGRFWRVSEHSLNAYYAKCQENGNGKKRMGADTKNKIKVHASIKSQEALPSAVERVNEIIGTLKDQIKTIEGSKKVPMIAKFQSAITLREELNQKMDGMDERFNNLVAKTYPELMGLVNEDPDTIEAILVEAARNPEKKMLDSISKIAGSVPKANAAGEMAV